jgi:hypothetical protein
MQSITNFCLRTERTLNVLGKIPIVSCATGAYRIFFLGSFQLCGGGISFCCGTVGLAAQLTGYATFSAKLYTYALFWADLFAHGILNVIRGVVEVCPVIGNIAVVVYDWVREGAGVISYVSSQALIASL